MFLKVFFWTGRAHMEKNARPLTHQAAEPSLKQKNNPAPKQNQQKKPKQERHKKTQINNKAKTLKKKRPTNPTTCHFQKNRRPCSSASSFRSSATAVYDSCAERPLKHGRPAAEAAAFEGKIPFLRIYLKQKEETWSLPV